MRRIETPHLKLNSCLYKQVEVELVTLIISPNSQIIADDVFQLDTLKMRGAKTCMEKKKGMLY